MASMQHLLQAQRALLMNLLNRQLFHWCMEIITWPFCHVELHEVMDPEGNVRSVVYDIAAYGGDLEEQCMVTAIECNSCLHCQTNLGMLNANAPTCQKISNKESSKYLSSSIMFTSNIPIRSSF
jgi:hypothetical protein